MANNADAVLLVRVSPGASADAFRGWATDERGRDVLKIAVTATAEDGKANDAVIRFLSKAVRHPKSAIEIRSGHTDRNKALRFSGLDQGALNAKLPAKED